MLFFEKGYPETFFVNRPAVDIRALHISKIKIAEI